MNKKTVIAFLLCLVLCASLFALPAFADDQTIIVIGPSVDPSTVSSTSVFESAKSVVVVSDDVSKIVSNGAVNTSAVSTAAPVTNPAVVVMPNGVSQAVSQTSVSQTQSVVTNQQIQTSSAQTAAASTPVVVQTQTAAVQTTSTQPPAGLASDILSLINQKRAENGLSALTYSDELQGAADTRAKESATNFSHLRPDGRGCETAVPVDYMVTGENLIQVTTEYATAAIMLDTWMNSPTHRNNILLSSFSEMAVGIYVVNGTTYVSTVFVGY